MKVALIGTSVSEGNSFVKLFFLSLFPLLSLFSEGGRKKRGRDTRKSSLGIASHVNISPKTNKSAFEVIRQTSYKKKNAGAMFLTHNYK